VASVTVAPDSQLVFAGDPFKITAKAKNAAGQVLAPPFTWTVAFPTIAKPTTLPKSAMTFKALKAGATSIKVTAGAKSSFSKVIVRSVTGASVVLTPEAATVAPGASVQFVAIGRTQAGENAGVKVTWTATGGTISQTGVLKAGTVPGTYRVIATSMFGKADTSAVTI
jgi:hypothetical protein